MTEEAYKRAVEIHKSIDDLYNALYCINDPLSILRDKDGREINGEEKKQAIARNEEELLKELDQLQQEFERL